MVEMVVRSVLVGECEGVRGVFGKKKKKMITLTIPSSFFFFFSFFFF